MPEPEFISLNLPPGVVKTDSIEDASRNYTDTQLTRFVAGRAESVGGWERINQVPFEGRARGMLSWNNNQGTPFFVVGTNERLYSSRDLAELEDITPIRIPGDTFLTDPFRAVDGVDTVTVTDEAHGRSNGDTVIFYGNADLDGTRLGNTDFNPDEPSRRLDDIIYTITVVDADTYTIPVMSVVPAASLTDPFTTTNGSSEVVVADAGHGHSFDDLVQFSGATAVGGVTVDGEYTLIDRTVDTYTIDVGANATSDATGGGTVSRAWVYTRIAPTGSTVFVTYNETNPFQTTVGSDIVRVNKTNHGAQTREGIIIQNADPVAGIDMNGTFEVASVIDENAFTIRRTNIFATSTTTGGGTPHFEFVLSRGPRDSLLQQRNYGQGAYGDGAYGSVEIIDDQIYYDARFWSLSRFGEDVIASPIGGDIYYWNSSLGGRATRINGAPRNVRGIYFTEERFLHVLGVNGNALTFGWANQNSVRDFTVSDISFARLDRRVQVGSTLVAMGSLSRNNNVIWTDSTLYSHQFIGGNFVYRTAIVATNRGLVGPQAYIIVNGTAYWMSASGFFQYSGGQPELIPNSQKIEQWVIDQIDDFQKNKTFVAYNALYNEVWFFYVPQLSGEPSAYAAVSLKDSTWHVGRITRTTGSTFDTGFPNPLWADENGFIYRHEMGNDADGQPMEKSITLGPLDVDESNSTFEILGFDPDFARLTGEINLEVRTWERRSEDPIDSETVMFGVTENIADLRSAGRYVELKLISNTLDGNYRLGKLKAELVISGAKR